MRSNALSWRRVRALCVKETRQIVRDPSSWLIAVVIPLLLLFIFGYGINLDSSKLRVGILLEQQSEEALDFTHAMTGSPYIDATISDNRQELIQKMQAGKIRGLIVMPVDFAAIILYLLYIDLATGGHWFLTFAFPVAGSIGALITTVVALLRYVRRGYLYIFGGALIAAGGLAMLLEFLLNLTFGVHQTFFWSFYPLAAGVLLGVMLIIIAVCPPLRRSLHRKFFL